jgi:hypothetical protein
MPDLLHGPSDSGPKATDVLVKTTDPVALDNTVQALPGCVAAVVGGPNGPFPRVEGAYVVRCFSGKDFLKFAIDQQGYGTVVCELEELL